MILWVIPAWMRPKSILSNAKVEYGNEMAKKAALMEKYSIAQNLLNMGLDIVDIMETIGLTETEILSLKEEQIV